MHSQAKMLSLIVVVAALAIFAGCGEGDQAHDSPLSHGPIVLTSTQTAASIWLRTDQPADVRLTWTANNESAGTATLVTATAQDDDLTGIFELGRLRADTCYSYEVEVDGVVVPDSDDQRFCTLPSIVDSLKIGLLGDLDKRLWIEAPAIAELADRQPDILLLVGDWDHRDPEDVDELWQMHRENRDPNKLAAQPLIDHFFNKVPIIYTWDDHDYGGNNSDRLSRLREDALRAYDDYWPANGRFEGQAGIWHKYSVGDLADVIMLDTRSQRDPDTYLDPRFVPDRTEGSNRGKLRDDPARSMLDGTAQPEGMSTGQKAWLKESLLTSPALWKVVVSSVTWNGTTVKDDAWWDFRAERNELVSFIQSNGITGVIFVTADLHTGGGIDDGTNANFPEVTIPSANLNQDEAGSPSCAIHPTPDSTLRTSCGDWSHGLYEHGSGYGLITLDRTQATIETVNLLGGTASLTLPRP